MFRVLAVVLGVMPLAGLSWSAGHGQTGVDGPKATERKNHDFVNSIGMKFAWIPPGTFLMGSPEGEQLRDGDETQHTVTLTRGFYLAVHPVTQEEWRAVMRKNPSQFKGANRPVEMVSWDDCQMFCEKLSTKEGKPYRLPTEGEWEYACRAGTLTPFHFGETISTAQANYDGSEPYGKSKKGQNRQETTLVETFAPNAWGLYDMHGNVWEWCADWYRSGYPAGDATDPQGPKKGERRVQRGGSWNSFAWGCRSARRDRDPPDFGRKDIGFRVCLCVEPDSGAANMGAGRRTSQSLPESHQEDACPKCGFKYAWDGKRCTHCKFKR